MTKNKNKKKKTKLHEMDGLTFKYLDDLRLYKDLKRRKESGEIKSFDIDTLLSVRPKDSKYKARKVIIDEHVLDSKLEAKYYLYALDLLKHKKIKSLDLKPSFLLQPAFKKNGRSHQAINYIADFKIKKIDGTVDIIDTKGMITPDFAIKEKMFEFQYPDLNLRVLKYVESYGGWIEHHDWRRERNKRRRDAAAKKKSKKT